MYEGIEDIYRLLDAGRLKEALTQLQGISTQTNGWELCQRIENTLTAYGYMLQYAGQGMEDPDRKIFFRQTLRTAYELTDTTNIMLLAQKTGSTYFDRIRTFTRHPAKDYHELQMQLEAFTEDASTASLLYHEEKRLEAEMEKIGQNHEAALTELFDKTWATPLWTETEAREATGILQSVLVTPADLAVMVSAATLSLIRVFDVRKFGFLLDAYRHEDAVVNQRAIVGMVIAIAKHEQRIRMYPDTVHRLSLLNEEENFRKNLQTIQMQLLITRETTKIDKMMREEIIPEMMKNAKQLNNPKFRFEESEDPEDRNPEWQEWMDKSGMTDKIKEMGEWQMAGADVYMSSFSQLKHYPFFYETAHWFYPFDLNQPVLASLKKQLDSRTASPLTYILHSDFFCNSDKYSFALALLGMSQMMKNLTMQQMEEQMSMNEESRNKLEQLIQKKQRKEAATISRQYIQDLYRFFKLWRQHQEEEDIFRWKFDLWANTLFGNVLQGEDILKELADYLLQKDYLDEAYTLFQKLAALGSRQAEVYQKAGFILQKQKRHDEAIRQYGHADLLQPDNVWTNKHLAQCHKLSGNLPKALEYYRKVEAVQPDNLNIALQIGQCLALMERYADALAYFYKVEYLEKNPDNARRAIAWCSFVSGKHEEALKYYRMLTDGPSAKAQDWMNTGHVHFVMRQVPQAIRFYQQAQSFEKSHTDFVEKFYKDRKDLLSTGLTEEDLQIMLDLLV